MNDSYEELVKLWREYNIRLEEEEYSGLRVAPDPDNEHTRALKNELPELPDHLGAIDSAIEWWRKHGEGLKRRPRMERLHHLLRRPWSTSTPPQRS